MKFEDKVANSIVLKEGLKKKKNRVKSKRGRIIGIIITFSLIAYLIFINALKFYKVDKSTFFDSEVTFDEIILYISFITIILKIILNSILAFLKKSIYSLNHYKVYSIIDIISNLNLFAFFALNIYNYYTILQSYNVWVNSATLVENITNLFKQDQKNLVLLAFTIVINFPVIIKFIIFSVTNGAVLYGSLLLIMLSPIFLIKYLLSNNRVFYQYEDYNDEYYVIRKRYIDTKGYGISTFFKKILLVLIMAIIIYAWIFLDLFMTNNLENYNIIWPMLLIGVFLLGYPINVLYFLDILQESHLEKKENDMKKLKEIEK